MYSDLCFWGEKDTLHQSFRTPEVKFSLAVSFFLSLNWYSTKEKADLIKDFYLQFMLNLFKGNLTLYAEFHLQDETATAAYAQCLEIWLSKMKASSQEMGCATKQQYSTLAVYLLFSWEFCEYICSIKFRNGQMEILSLHSSPKHSQEEQSTTHYPERQIWTMTWKRELTSGIQMQKREHCNLCLLRAGTLHVHSYNSSWRELQQYHLKSRSTPRIN